MKFLNLKVNDCTDCPYMDIDFHNTEDGWCCKSEDDIVNIYVIPDWCELDGFETERECRCGGGCGK